MRGYVKGGIWKNTEDEILKAAVMKYGKNQWARIASLLSRKSAKQCKTRWYEWLDPSIKKTEWSREEEEKLLHLAKIMPCQWRSIAPIVGRTAAQCLDHYEKLLDAASQKDDYDPAEDPRRLRPGEIDPNPESKPARPDHVDMEEDEKEMLQEARARLANTKGKKAKRKARERHLEDARRMATLQKRRELKAAGIAVHKRRKKRRGIDYNKEIPFLHKAAPGYYSTTNEREKELLLKQNPNFTPVLLQQLEGERRDEMEERARKKDVKKLKEKLKNNLPDAVMQINNATSIDHARRRTELIMPDSQMSDQEIREIAKMGYDPEMEEDGDEPQSDATKALLSKYVPTPTPHHAIGSMTPSLQDRTPARPDTVLMEAQNLRALTTASTPLIGGENVQLHPSDFSGATPKTIMFQTPNPLITPLRAGGNQLSLMASPAVRGVNPLTPRRTPMRDQLNINEGTEFGDDEEVKHKQIDQRKFLQDGLASLPKPREYKVALPDLPDDFESMDDDTDDLEKKAKNGTAATIVDAEDLEKQKMEKVRKLEEAKLKARSTVLRRELPRPFSVPSTYAKSTKEIENMKKDEMAAELIKAEMISMITNDALKYPTKQIKPPQNTDGNFHYEIFPEDQLKKARKMLEDELEVTKHRTQGEFSFAEYVETWERCHNDVIYLPHVKKVYLNSLVNSESDRMIAMQFQYDVLKKDLLRQAKKCKSAETVIDTYFAGYEKVANIKKNDIHNLYRKIAEARTELECFTVMKESEAKSIDVRVENMKLEVDRQHLQETQLLSRLANLTHRKNELVQLHKSLLVEALPV